MNGKMALTASSIFPDLLASLIEAGGGQAKSTVFFGKHVTSATTNDQPPTQDDNNWVA